MKVRHLRRIVKHILEEPLRINMDDLIRSRNSKLYGQLQQGVLSHLSKETVQSLPDGHVHRWPSCNTVACLSGWEILLYGNPTKDDIWSSIERLELPNKDLFYLHYWPQPWQSKIYSEKPGTKAYAQVVAQAVEDYIKTGGWPNPKTENQVTYTSSQDTYF